MAVRAGTYGPLAPVLILILAAILLDTASLAAVAAPRMSRPLYRALEQVRSHIQEGQAKQALTLLKSVDAQARDDYSRAIVEQNFGYIWLELERPEAAAQAFRQALERNALPKPAQNNMRYNLAGILARLDRTPEAVRLLETYLETAPDPPLQSKTLLARLYLDQAKYKAAVRLLEAVRRQLKKPDETVLLLLVSAYGERKQLRRTLPLLEDLVRIAPGHGGYWQRLAATHLALGQEQKALAVLESAYLQGLTGSPDQLRYLAHLYLHQGVPYKAGRLLEREVRSGRLQPDASSGQLAAQAWQLAHENDKAEAALKRMLDDASGPDPFQQLARLYLDREAWDDAAQTLERGIRGASGDQRARMLLTLGMVRFRQQRIDAARAAFEQMPRDSAAWKQAQQWLRYLDNLEAAGS